MATLPQAVQQIPAAPTPRAAERLGDGELLERFISRQDGSAFEELVRRHSRMVLGVCQRILHNPHDAEDCFQAVFLVLVRKATSIQPREMVGNWLYGVAYRTALEARKMAARRRVMERKKPELPSGESIHQRWHELRPVLDQELSRLPDKYRAVLVACDLEGKTRQEAACLLRLPEGTVASRLSRARALLAKRVSRHSMSMSMETLALVLAEKANKTCVPASLLSATVSAAGRLTAGKAISGFVSPRVIVLTESTATKLFIANQLKLASGVAAILLLITALAIGVAGFTPDKTADKKTDVENPGLEQPVKPSSPDIDRSTDGEIAGVVVAINDDSLTIESTASAERTVVKKIADVKIDGKKAKFSDLKVKMKVTMKMSAAKPAIVEAVGPKVSGVLKSINAEGNVISITIDGTHLVAEGITVTEDAPVVINSRKSRLADLRPGMRATVQMSADSQQSVIIGITTPGLKQE